MAEGEEKLAIRERRLSSLKLTL